MSLIISRKADRGLQDLLTLMYGNILASLFTQSWEVALMETLGILLLLMKSLRLRLGLVELESFTDTTPVGGKKFWIVGFLGLFILPLLDDISNFSSEDRICKFTCGPLMVF